jgi:hypothetical protein
MPHRALTTLLIALTLTTPVFAAEPLRALLLTSPGVYHNYQYQSLAIATALSRRANVTFEVSLSELDRWRSGDFAAGYDVLVYNICMADNTDAALIANLRRQTTELGVPALVLHCTMHSFRTTGDWWPFYGLKTVAHEPLRPLRQQPVAEHPVLNGIPADWTVADDELYINLAFEATPLLTATGQDGQPHVTTWLHESGGTAVFGTTLGHTDETIDDPVFQRLLGNALLFVTGKLGPDGEPLGAVAQVAVSGPVDLPVFTGEGIRFLGEAGLACVQSEFRDAAGLCYIGCMLHPLKWGEDAEACRRDCQALLPSPDEVATLCMPAAP